MNDDFELSILESIYCSSKHERQAVTQRELARTSGLSLGMTNAVIKRFVEKGWISARKLNSRTIRYAMTPEGISEIAHRTYRYFKRTARNVAVYKDILEDFVADERRKGVRTLVLAGASDLDFVLEYLCERHELTFAKTADPEKALALAKPGTVIVLAETVGDVVAGEGVASLKTLITGTRVADAVSNGSRE
jgi:DNA-binding MarR family transcriptional regulator